MINKNLWGLRQLALRSYSELISHCRLTTNVTPEIKTTRTALQRIAPDYVNGLRTLYLSETITTEGDRAQILTALQDFASISKSIKMSNLFLQEFAGLHQRFTPNPLNGIRLVQELPAQRELEVLLAMMEKVKLVKDNYISLMKGLKLFIENTQTQKTAYKLLAKIIEKFELANIQELQQIQKELNPLLKGQASKQRVMLILSYVKQM